MPDSKEDTADPSALPTVDRPTGKPLQATFQPAELMAGRFRIIRFIARGGMGEVYEAEDLELREHVALKTVRPEIAADERAMERFRREVQIARKVTHPNVCRIFDVFHHQSATTEVTFLTMELLQGETLTERLRKRRMSPAEAMPIVRQMADALTAAHNAGIIHRDFKSANVMLVPTKSPLLETGDRFLPAPTFPISMKNGSRRSFGVWNESGKKDWGVLRVSSMLWKAVAQRDIRRVCKELRRWPSPSSSSRFFWAISCMKSKSLQ